jgi:DNA polymerase delta subunit 3
MVRIVDMDEVSEGERNSEDGVEEDEGMIGGWNGNDEGAGADGLGAVNGGEGGEEIRSEEVKRWGVVLVQKDGLEGESIILKTRQVYGIRDLS